MTWEQRNDGRLLERLFKEKHKGYYSTTYRTTKDEKKRRKRKMAIQIDKKVSKEDFNSAPETHPEMPTFPDSDEDEEGPPSEGRQNGGNSASANKKQKREPIMVASPAASKLHPDAQGLTVSAITDCLTLKDLTFQQLYDLIKLGGGTLSAMTQLTPEEIAALKTTIEEASAKAEKECECLLLTVYCTNVAC